MFLSATCSAFFSPAKYGILPEVFEDQDISEANGILELTTDLAIPAESIAGVYVYRVFQQRLANAGIVFVVAASPGTVAIAFAPKALSGNRGTHFVWNIVKSFRFR